MKFTLTHTHTLGCV